MPGETIYGMTPEAGLTKGFRYADGRRLMREPAGLVHDGAAQ